MIMYPSPLEEVRNSPTMTPTHDKPTLTFSVEIMVGKQAGRMAPLKHCAFVAPNVCKTFI